MKKIRSLSCCQEIHSCSYQARIRSKGSWPKTFSIVLDCHLHWPWTPERGLDSFSLNSVGCHISTLFWIRPLMSEPMLREWQGETHLLAGIFRKPLVYPFGKSYKRNALAVLSNVHILQAICRFLLSQILCLYVSSYVSLNFSFSSNKENMLLL